MATADLVLFVVDGQTGATDTDLVVARTLRRSDRPVLLAVTKIDDERAEPDASELWSLGLGEPHPVSGLHGRGSGDLLDAIIAALPAAPPEQPEDVGPRRVALIGRPNVGKSSLLNRLTGEERAVVDPVAGTTIDPVDSLVELGGEIWRFVDTAGLRRRVRQAAGMEYYASLRTASAIEAAEVAIVLLDASEPLSEQDQRVIADVVDAGRALVHRVQQVGPRRRGPPRPARARDRSRARPGSRGRRGSTSRHVPAARSTSWPLPCARAWPPGTGASPPAG